MANYSILKAAIAQVIKTNGNNEITGNLLQQQLFSMVNTLGTGYQCMGVAVLTPTPTNPGTPDANVFYIASEPGTYANFGNIVINDGEVCLLTYNGTWSKRVTGAATASQLNQLGQYEENPEWVRVVTDADGKILYGVKTDGKFYFGEGCPEQVKTYIKLQLGKYTKSEFDNITSFLDGLEDEGLGLRTLLFEKVDKETGKSLINSVFASAQTIGDYSEYYKIETDNNGLLLEGISAKGEKIINIPLRLSAASFDSSYAKEWLYIITDYSGKILLGIKQNGEILIGTSTQSKFDYFPIDKYMPIMANLKRREVQAQTGVMGNYETFTLSCLTDTHGDTEAIINFIDFNKRYGRYIDDSFINGDLIVDNFTKPYVFESIKGYDKILLGLGNHDAYQENWHSLSDVVPLADVYNRYFAHNISKWGVNYTQGVNYYCKDYSAAKVRFIVLDCMYWDATQKMWLENTLGDTLNLSNPAYGYHVIIAQHIPNAHNTDELVPFDCSFNSKDDISVYHCAYFDSIEVVDSFQQNGGHFITWLFGHWHADFVGTFANYPNQMLIVQNVGSGTSAEMLGWTDTERIENTESRNLFNIYSVDTTKEYLRIARIGAKYDRNLQHKGTLLISYKPNDIKVLSNF